MRIWKRIAKGVGIGVVSLAALFAAYLFIGGFDLPRPPDDADLVLPDPEPVPDEENAFWAFLGLTNALTLSSAASPTNILSDRALAGYYGLQVESDHQHPDAYEWFRTNRLEMVQRADRILAENAHFFAAFSDVARMKRYQSPGFFENLTNTNAVAYTDVGTFFLVRDLYGLRIQRKIEKKEFVSALEDCEMLFAFGRLTETSYGIDVLLGDMCRDFAMRKMTHLVLAGGTPDSLFNRIEKWIADSEPRKEDIDQSAKMAYSYSRGILMGMTRDHLIKILKKEGSVPSVVYEWSGGIRFAFHRNASLSKLAKWTRQTLRGEAVKIPDVPCVFAMCRSPFEFLIPNWLGKSLMHLQVIPDGESAITRLSRRQFAYRSWRIALAVAKWRKVNGCEGYPATLEELVPAYIDAIPDDPFDPGHPVRYHRETGVVWSVGNERTFDYVQTPETGKDGAGIHRGVVSRLDGKTVWRKKE